MTLVVATIPEDPAELAGWLERRLVGLELDGLVAELTAIHKPTISGLTVRDILGSKLDSVRTSGLSCLTREQLGTLLTRPALLLDLQEEILRSGGLYWDQVARTQPALSLEVEKGRKRLPGTPSTAPKAKVHLASSAVTPWYRQAWFASLATAAAIFVCVGAWMVTRPEPGSPAWGWQRAGAIRSEATASAYLNHLSDGANEWFQQRPQDEQALAARIGEMRQGCSRLILSPHEPLSAKDKEWLVEKCKAWAKEFDKALTALEEGKSVDEVRGQVDKTVERLANAIRERAKQV